MKHLDSIYKIEPTRELKKYDLDLTKDKIPISPASHYACGGILVDIFGRTSLKNLLAFGEVACTGIHGANRLASNSLLEAIVFSDQIDKIASEFPKKIREIKVEKHKIHRNSGNEQIRNNLRKINWENMGLVRTKSGLRKLLEEIEMLLKNNKKRRLSLEKIETENMLSVSRETARAALSRKESLGTHFINL